jgi:hypothetical protein
MNSAEINSMHTAKLAISLLLLLCGAAMARPRDDVMIDVYRCAEYASSRAWLDCYYGAAQPQRAVLGLMPAPAAQIQLTRKPPAPGVPQDVQTRDAVIVAAAKCGSVAAERSWLDCYYSAANPMRVLLGLSSIPVSAVATVPVLPARPASVAPGRALGTPGIHGARQMTSYTFDRNGYFTAVLENGEVWRQLDGDTSTARWFKKTGSYIVTITAGALGSFNFRVKGEPGSFKVRRVS